MAKENKKEKAVAREHMNGKETSFTASTEEVASSSNGQNVRDIFIFNYIQYKTKIT